MDNTEILVAAMSDPEFKVRLAELREEQAAIKSQHDALLEDINHRAELVAQAHAANAAADEKLAEVKARETKLKDDTEGLGRANRAMNDEKERWEKIRQAVDVDQKKWSDELADRESKVEAREKIVEKREKDVIAEGEALAAAQRKHQAAADHAARFLRALDAPAA